MKFVRILLIAIACIASERLCRLATDGFAIAKMVPLCENKANFGTAPKEVLSQRFSYLGKGGQCYVFASEDGHYVLKFFRKNRHLERMYKSLAIAGHSLPAETGLIYIHLAHDELPPLQIVDKLQIAHTIDPNAYGFVLQRRAELVRPYLASLMEQGKIEEAKGALQALFHLAYEIRAKGIADGDANLAKNFGFLEGKPVEIDVGSFGYTSKKLIESKEDLLQWLNAHYPILSPPFEEAFQSYSNACCSP